MKSDAGQTVRREFSSVEQVTKIEKLGKWEQIFYSKNRKAPRSKDREQHDRCTGPFDSLSAHKSN